jgi:hypothetical protein
VTFTADLDGVSSGPAIGLDTHLSSHLIVPVAGLPVPAATVRGEQIDVLETRRRAVRRFATTSDELTADDFEEQPLLRARVPLDFPHRAIRALIAGRVRAIVKGHGRPQRIVEASRFVAHPRLREEHDALIVAPPGRHLGRDVHRANAHHVVMQVDHPSAAFL